MVASLKTRAYLPGGQGSGRTMPACNRKEGRYNIQISHNAHPPSFHKLSCPSKKKERKKKDTLEAGLKGALFLPKARAEDPQAARELNGSVATAQNQRGRARQAARGPRGAQAEEHRHQRRGDGGEAAELLPWPHRPQPRCRRARAVEHLAVVQECPVPLPVPDPPRQRRRCAVVGREFGYRCPL